MKNYKLMIFLTFLMLLLALLRFALHFFDGSITDPTMEIILVSMAFFAFCAAGVLIYFWIKRWKIISKVYIFLISTLIAHFLIFFWFLYFHQFIDMPAFLFRYAKWLLSFFA